VHFNKRHFPIDLVTLFLSVMFISNVFLRSG
jgi:hypothetical protein